MRRFDPSRPSQPVPPEGRIIGPDGVVAVGGVAGANAKLRKIRNRHGRSRAGRRHQAVFLAHSTGRCRVSKVAGPVDRSAFRAEVMKEFRCIIFTEQEVLTAVIERRRRAREQLPVGTIQGVTYDSTDGNAVFARIRIADDYGKVTDVVARAAELAAALVEYCLNRKIPMPTGSSKWIK